MYNKFFEEYCCILRRIAKLGGTSHVEIVEYIGLIRGGVFNGGEHILLSNDLTSLADHKDYYYLHVFKIQTIAARREH